MHTEIAMITFFTVQVIFNISIVQKTERLEKWIKHHNERLNIHFDMIKDHIKSTMM